jgi:hypothetical protein
MLIVPPLTPRVPPTEPQEPAPARSTLVYVKEPPPKWEYKVLSSGSSNGEMPDQAALNALGVEGWELVGIATRETAAILYFKRQVR